MMLISENVSIASRQGTGNAENQLTITERAQAPDFQSRRESMKASHRPLAFAAV